MNNEENSRRIIIPPLAPTHPRLRTRPRRKSRLRVAFLRLFNRHRLRPRKNAKGRYSKTIAARITPFRLNVAMGLPAPQLMGGEWLGGWVGYNSENNCMGMDSGRKGKQRSRSSANENAADSSSAVYAGGHSLSTVSVLVTDRHYARRGRPVDRAWRPGGVLFRMRIYATDLIFKRPGRA